MNKQDCKAPIFAISRLRMGIDGAGITTLVTFMDCPLHCKYCLNDRCHDSVYEADGVTLKKGTELLSPQELYDRVKIDNLYFQVSGGGICFGGGEPTLYENFIIEFRKLCGNDWKITLETSLNRCSYSTIQRLAPIVDMWIVDIKEMDSHIYEQYTGHRSHILQSLDCLRKLELMNKTTVKVPLIPDFNTEEDVQSSIEELKQMGFHNIEPIRYIKRLSKYSHKKQK